MINQPTSQAALELLRARDALLVAKAAASIAQEKYNQAEQAYVKSAKEGPPANLLIGETLIMARDEWYDSAIGQQLEYHTVQRLEVT